MSAAIACLLGLLVVLQGVVPRSERIEKTTVASGGKTRYFYVFLPARVKPGTTSPLIVMLHGSGRNGSPLVQSWRELASREGIILAGPDATNSADWVIPADGPELLRDLVESLKSKYPVDQRRVYLFGHSLGANFALRMSLLQSEYFAATAVHAGWLEQKQDREFLRLASRKIPIAIFVGTNDQYYPLSGVRRTRDMLIDQGFPTHLKEIRGHDHDYYSRAPDLNPEIWKFLRQHELPGDQRYVKQTFTVNRQ